MFHNPMGRALYQQRGLRGRGIPQDLQTALTSSFPVWTQMPQGGGDAVEYVRFAALKQSTSAVRTAVRVSLGQAGAAALVRSLESWADLLLQPLAERAPVFRLDAILQYRSPNEAEQSIRDGLLHRVPQSRYISEKQKTKRETEGEVWCPVYRAAVQFALGDLAILFYPALDAVLYEAVKEKEVQIPRGVRGLYHLQAGAVPQR